MSLRFKRGTTVRLQCTHSLSGATVDLTGYTITSSASRGSGSALPFTVTIAPDQSANRGEFTLAADTASWAEGDYRVDVRMSVSSLVYYSETFSISIVSSVTQS
jgi:hypothetical protein